MVILNNDILLSLCLYLRRKDINKLCSAVPWFRESLNTYKNILYSKKCDINNVSMDADPELSYETRVISQSLDLYKNGTLLATGISSIVKINDNLYLYAKRGSIYRLSGTISYKIFQHHSKHSIYIFTSGLYIYYIDLDNDKINLYNFQMAKLSSILLGTLSNEQIRNIRFWFETTSKHPLYIEMENKYIIKNGELSYGEYILQ